ncbi:MAG TPA: hypothetical protein VL527_16275 [Dongiaceae bacterium]|nr:hypothetical protein [Dongiaceae bacterium]
MKKAMTAGGVFLLMLLAALWLWHHGKLPAAAAPNAELAGTWLTTGPDGGQRRVTFAPGGAMTVLIHGRTVGRLDGWSFRENGMLVGIITNSTTPMRLPATNSARIVRLDAQELIVQPDVKTQVAFKKVMP